MCLCVCKNYQVMVQADCGIHTLPIAAIPAAVRKSCRFAFFPIVILECEAEITRASGYGDTRDLRLLAQDHGMTRPGACATISIDCGLGHLEYDVFEIDLLRLSRLMIGELT